MEKVAKRADIDILQFKEVGIWHYNNMEIVTRIPELVCQVWENGYGVNLRRFECTPAPSYFNGAHMGKGAGITVDIPDDKGITIFLARDEKRNPCLIRRKPKGIPVKLGQPISA